MSKKPSRVYACRTTAGDTKRGCGGKARVISDIEAKGYFAKLENKLVKKMEVISAEVKSEAKELTAEVKDLTKEVKQLKAGARARDHKIREGGKKRSHHKKKS